MKELYITEEQNGISADQLDEQLSQLLAQWPNAKKILIIPPDYTRCYSYAGVITQILYQKLSPSSTVHVMPALGTHMAMDDEELYKFFGNVVPKEAILVHHWQNHAQGRHAIDAVILRMGMYPPIFKSLRQKFLRPLGNISLVRIRIGILLRQGLIRLLL